MKIWIVYDTKYGSNRKIAEMMKSRLEKNNEVCCSQTKYISPKKIIAEMPDAFLFGGPRRMGKISFTLRRWVEKYSKLLASNHIQMKKVGAWETHGAFKEEDLHAESKMERNIAEANFNIGKLWGELLHKVPSVIPSPELLSILIEGMEDGNMGNGRLESGAEGKINDFITHFEEM
jgi:flavodoxin